MASPSIDSPDPNPQPSWRFVLILLTVLLAAFLLAYARSFLVKPASDDWPIVTEMHRGNLRGVGTFFTDSVIRIGYRPLKSLLIWAMCNLGGESVAARMAWVRAAHLLAAVAYALVALLWIRSLPIGHAGTMLAMAVMFLHPVLPQAVGSVDGVDTLASAALLWLGAWCVYRFRDRLAPAAATSILCFIVGVGFKENLFALVPLAMLVVVTFYRRERRLRGGLTIGAALLVAAILAIAVRSLVIRGGLESGGKMLDFSPRQLAENVALFAAGLLFFGNSVWVFLNQSKLVFALVGLWCAIVFGLVLIGLHRRGEARWACFFALGLAIASFPTVLLYHVSEMYVPPMLLPFALLCGLAADGWRGAHELVRAVLGFFCGAALVISFMTIRHKIAGLVDVGARTDRQMRQVLDFLPPGTRDASVMLLFDARQLPPRRTYSVFRMGDEILLVHKMCLEWYRPGDGLQLDSVVVDDPSQFDATPFDLVLLWDSAAQRFTAFARRPPRGAS